MLDFGGQYSQLIARRIRECGVFSELLPHDRLAGRDPRAQARGWCSPVGRRRSTSRGRPRSPTELLELGVPMLGICYGMQAMARRASAVGSRRRRSGSSAAPSSTRHRRRRAPARGLPEEQSCWMSHRDTVFEPPPGFDALASSPGSPVAACESPERGLYGIQFHPEVVHTPYGTEILTPLPARHRRMRAAAGRRQSIIDEQVDRIRAQVGDGTRDLRPLGRSRLLGRGAARPQGGRRPAHLRLRRPRPDAEERERAGRRGLPSHFQHPARPRRRGGSLPREAGRRGRPRDEAQDHRRGVHPRLRGGGRRSSRTPASWCRERSTPT